MGTDLFCPFLLYHTQRHMENISCGIHVYDSQPVRHVHGRWRQILHNKWPPPIHDRPVRRGRTLPHPVSHYPATSHHFTSVSFGPHVKTRLILHSQISRTTSRSCEDCVLVSRCGGGGKRNSSVARSRSRPWEVHAINLARFCLRRDTLWYERDVWSSVGARDPSTPGTGWTNVTEIGYIYMGTHHLT